MSVIPLTQGKFALVDDEDFPYLSQFKWQANFENGTWYARRTTPRPNRQTIKMHNEIMKAKGVDHRNRDGLDNQKNNLRIATRSQNALNTKLNSNNTSGEKGVVWFNQTSKWLAEIRLDYKKINLGYYDTKPEAVAARKAADRIIELITPEEKEIQQRRQQLTAERERCDEIWRIGKAELSAERDYGNRLTIQLEEAHQKLAAERDLRDEARAQREHLIKECGRIGVTVNVAIGAPITEAYVLVNTLGDTTDAAIEQKRLEIWRDAPNQLDIQEAVIKKLDLVHRHAIDKAQQPLVNALKKCKSQLDMEPQRLPLVERLQGYIKDALEIEKEDS